MAETRSAPKSGGRKIHHGQPLARLNSPKKTLAGIVYSLSQPEILIFFLLALIFFLLATMSYYSRPTEVNRLLANAQTAFNNNDFQISYQFLNQAVLMDNTNPQIHFQLSRVYSATNNLEEAKKELLLALQISPDAASILKELNKVQATLKEPKTIEAELNFWKQEVSTKPDYRDGWLQLAVRNFELYRVEDAKFALARAFQLDPNFETTKKLMEIIRYNQEFKIRN